MYYKKIRTDHALIEFHNNWLGMETVIVNGKIVSKKSSLAGTNHQFIILEEGKKVAYILTTKLGVLGQVFIDLRRDGELIQENLLVKHGTKSSNEDNKFKAQGMKFLNDYDIPHAIEAFKKGLAFDKKDPEIYFYLACCASIEERADDGFEYIKKAVENNLHDREMILNHEMLAFLRLQDSFEEFLNSNFTAYGKNNK
ncbi:MAG: hypothetical protein Sapg2KO_27670 [Saprospiraceae bacterium]